MIGNEIQAIPTPSLYFEAEKQDSKHITRKRTLQKNCDRDSSVKICLQPELEAQKVEKHCNRQFPT